MILSGRMVLITCTIVHSIPQPRAGTYTSTRIHRRSFNIFSNIFSLLLIRKSKCTWLWIY